MYKIKIDNRTSDTIFVYAAENLYEITSGGSVVYNNENRPHPIVISGLNYEIVSNLNVIAAYDMETILEVNESANIIVRVPR